MARVNDVTIRSKFAGIVLISTLGLMAILTLASYLLATYRVNGPVYERIIKRKGALADFQPTPLFLVEPYAVLSRLKDATDPAEVKRLTERVHKFEAEYHQSRDFWLKELPEGPTRQG